MINIYKREEPKNIKNTLFEYVKNPDTWFYWYHSPDRLEALYDMDHCVKVADYTKSSKKLPDYEKDGLNFTKRTWRFKGKDVEFTETIDKKPVPVVIEENLAEFFDAVLDEVRIKKANAFAEYALYISDNEDLAYFRDTLAKREVSADIDYERQRDHAVHTLYNYLLGWYIFENSPKLQGAFRDHFKNLNINNIQEKNLREFYQRSYYGVITPKNTILNTISISEIHEFADVWFIASLLHDIGYILEGRLSSASAAVENTRIANGSKIIHDYFNHHFWRSFEIDFRAAKNIAKILGVVIPDFSSSRSVASLADHLCDIGSCENIRKKLSNCPEYANYKPIQQAHGLNREAFSIWKEHYEHYNKTKMKDILYVVERVYKNMVWVGDDYGKRNLDHGVCSGLITLQALTFFREFYWGFKRLNTWADFNREQGQGGESYNYVSHGMLNSLVNGLAKTDADADANTNSPHHPELFWVSNQLNKWLYFDENHKKSESCNYVSEEIFTHIKAEITRVPKRIGIGKEVIDELRSDFWFKKILWATAASAIHAIVQKDEYSEQCKKHINVDNKDKNKDYLKIGFNDDPLAFLGILVDVLQEWDRYKVAGRGESAFSGDEPLQSVQVEVDDKDSPICFKYPDEKKDWKKDIEKTMNKCLENNSSQIDALKKIINDYLSDIEAKKTIKGCSDVVELKKTLNDFFFITKKFSNSSDALKNIINDCLNRNYWNIDDLKKIIPACSDIKSAKEVIKNSSEDKLQKMIIKYLEYLEYLGNKNNWNKIVKIESKK